MDGSDTFFYWVTARDWAAGKFELTEHYRPLAYLLYAFAMQLGGINDSSIKILNGSLDVLVMLSICALSWRLFRSWRGVFSILLFYVSLPEIVYQARSELLHMPSSLWVLLSILSLLMFSHGLHENGRPVWGWLAAAGLSMGLSMHVHPSLIVILPGYGLALWALTWRKWYQKGDRRVPLLSVTMIWSICVFLPFLFVILNFGFNEFISSLTAGSKAQAGSAVPLLQNVRMAAAKFVDVNSSQVFRWGFWGASLYILISSVWRRKVWPGASWLLLALCWSFILFYCILIPRHFLERTYIPMLVPCALLVYMALRRALGERVALAAFVVFAIFNRLEMEHPGVISIQQPISFYRETQNVLAANGWNSQRVLMASLMAESFRTPMAQPSVLGRRALYLLNSTETSWQDLLEKQNIELVILSRSNLDGRIPRDEALGQDWFLERLRTLYGKMPNEFSLQWEEAHLTQLLAADGWKEAYASERMRIFKK